MNAPRTPRLDEASDQLDTALAHDDQPTAADALIHLALTVGELRHTGDPATVASYRGWVDRLTHRHSATLDTWPVGRRQMTLLVAQLDNLYTHVWQEQEHDEAGRKVATPDMTGLTLKGRILHRLTHSPRPLRPSDLVAGTESDPTQVSRALRQLVSEKSIQLVAAPANIADDRARWYAPTAQATEVETRTG